MHPLEDAQSEALIRLLTLVGPLVERSVHQQTFDASWSAIRTRVIALLSVLCQRASLQADVTSTMAMSRYATPPRSVRFS